MLYYGFLQVLVLFAGLTYLYREKVRLQLFQNQGAICDQESFLVLNKQQIKNSLAFDDNYSANTMFWFREKKIKIRFFNLHLYSK